MNEIYLFDWGDTLMVDLKGFPGKMCEWDIVEAVDGAFETLECLSRDSQIYIATGAAESSEEEIKLAFKRVSLDPFISAYFCKSNVGISKGEPGFLASIITSLGVAKERITMVGDSLEKDIKPALAAGITPVLFNPHGSRIKNNLGVREIHKLQELCS